MIVLDIWGGEGSMDHVARYIVPDAAEAMRIGVKELEAGFLVNLRRDAAFGPEENFDDRTGAMQ